ncbi:MAG: hypothetical protein H8E66_06920 [Planctomycetes bacterium]|nr:hypothetical protein [Planctomycetota bacterium]
MIPREVRLVAGEAMRGWQSKFFGQSQPSFVADAAPATTDWFVSDGTLRAKKQTTVGTHPQSLLR